MSEQNIDQIVSRLAAKDEIRELTARYCHAVVDGNADTIVGLFCEDGVFQAHTFVSRGHTALREFYENGVGGKTHKPFVQNHVIDFKNDTEAFGRCSVEIRVLENGEAYTQAGHYNDRYRKERGSWRFVERQYVRNHNVPWRHGWKR